MSCWIDVHKICATCRYWAGKRDVDAKATFFQTRDEKGVCYGPYGSFRGEVMKECSSCLRWGAYHSEEDEKF